MTIGLNELERIAEALALRMRVPLPDRGELRENYLAVVPLPVISQRDGRCIWVDRYYAAYRDAGGRVEYVYLSLAHIREERDAVRTARRRRGSAAESLPPEIEAAFSKALRFMRRYAVSVWLAPECVKLLQSAPGSGKN